MKLFELARGSHFMLDQYPTQPPGYQHPAHPDVEYILNNIDGMYSHCQDESGNVYHFAAWTEVSEV